MKEIITFHIANKYYIEVNKIKNGCRATFPENILTSPKFPKLSIDYILKDKSLEVKIDNQPEIIKEIPRYAANLIILTDLMLKATERQISLRLIKVFDGLVLKEKLDDIIQLQLSEIENKKTNLIVSKYSDIVTGLFDGQAASNLGIYDAFNVLVSLTNAGGF